MDNETVLPFGAPDWVKKEFESLGYKVYSSVKVPMMERIYFSKVNGPDKWEGLGKSFYCPIFLQPFVLRMLKLLGVKEVNG